MTVPPFKTAVNGPFNNGGNVWPVQDNSLSSASGNGPFDYTGTSELTPPVSGPFDSPSWPVQEPLVPMPSTTGSFANGAASVSIATVSGPFDSPSWPVQAPSVPMPSSSGSFPISAASVSIGTVSGPFDSPRNIGPVEEATYMAAGDQLVQPAGASSGSSGHGYPLEDNDDSVWSTTGVSVSIQPNTGRTILHGSTSSPAVHGPFVTAHGVSASNPPVNGPLQASSNPLLSRPVQATSNPLLSGPVQASSNPLLSRPVQTPSVSNPLLSGPIQASSNPLLSGPVQTPSVSNPLLSGPVQTSGNPVMSGLVQTAYSSCPPVGDNLRSAASVGPGGSLSAIAARRAAQQNSQSLVQPEQDVIYKQYNPQASLAHLSPPPTIRPPSVTPVPATPGFPTFDRPTITQSPVGPPVVSSGQSHVGPPVVSSGQSPVGPPVVSSGQSPVGPPVVSSGQSPVGPPVVSSGSVSSSSIESRPFGVKTDVGGLRVFCAIGFGGRLVIGGGRFGHRIATATLGTVLGLAGMPTKHMIDEIKNCPSALGSVTPLTTEHVISYSASQIATSSAFTNGEDANLLWKFFQSIMTAKRVDFLVSLWLSACEEYAVDTTAPLYTYVARIVEGNLREALQLGSSLNLHAVSMAIASIHSAEFFRESILLFTTNMGQQSGTMQESVGDAVLWEVVRVTITAFASTGSLEPLFESSHNQLIKHWKLYLCLVASLVRPDSQTTGGGSAFLLRLGDLLVSRRNIAGGHLCILLSGRRTSLDSVDSSDALISLLGADHRDTAHFYRLLDPGPLQLSEVYEYATRVKSNVQFFVPLQPWKYAYASMLACDLGFFDIAEKYLEIINAYIRAVPTGKYSVHFRNGLRELELRIARANSHEPPHVAPSVVDVGQAALGAIWGGLTRIL